jgi:RecA-family ATPase
MQLSDIEAALTGNTLKDAMFKAKEKRNPIAEGFIYEQTITMISADPGTGKSTITSQVAVELAAGLPVFGTFDTFKPRKVLYAQTERNIIELLERLETISKVLPILHDNLVITDAYQQFNLLNPEHAKVFIDCVMRDCPDADIIILDPIYCLVGGGLKDDLPASAFTKVMSNLQKATNAALWYNHHTVKPSYTNKGEQIEKSDPFYGSQWLKAHVTGSFHLKQCDGGVMFERKKDNYHLLPQEIILEYDPESGISHIPLADLPAAEKVRRFLKVKEVSQESFSFKDIETETKVCTRRLRELLVHSSFSDRLLVVSSLKNKKLYKIKTPN